MNIPRTFGERRRWVNRNFRIKIFRQKKHDAPKINKLIGFRYMTIIAGDRYVEQIMRRLIASKADKIKVRLRNRDIEITFYSK